MANVIEIDKMTKEYQDFSLKEISFNMPKGYIMGFIGPNGSGKTTTIKAILNMIHYQSGDIKVFGLDNQLQADLINEQIGVVLDSNLFVDDWTATDVEKAVAPFYSLWDSQKYTELLSKFNINRTKKVKDLSRGMKVKLMLAVALSHHAKLLILDEPTSGLDPVARDELCDMFSDYVLNEENSILFSTHITADLEKIADYITFILDGKIIFSGPKEDLLEKFLLVKGGLDELNAELRKLLIGLREYGTGFEGLIEAQHIGQLTSHFMVESVTLDEIIIFLNKGMKADE